LKEWLRFLFLVLLAVILIGFNMKFQAETKADLITIFKELDALDYKMQGMVGEDKEIERLAREIYCKQQLKKVLSYLREMEEKGVRFKLDNVNYDSIEVLDYNNDMATLRVEAHTMGSYYSIEEPIKKVKDLDITTSYQVTMFKEGDKWKISKIAFLK